MVNRSTNDNNKPRQVRDGLLRKWPDADFVTIATDETLLRLAEARNESSDAANKFMLFGALGAFIYLLRLEGVANDLKFGDYSLANLPFGLFVSAATALVLATVALIRIGDSRGFDRQLRLACEKRYSTGCHAQYTAFPNSKALGESFSFIAGVIDAGIFITIARAIALILVSIFIFALIIAPAVAGIDYIANGRYQQEGTYEDIRFWLVLLLTIANVLTLILVMWTRLADEG
jgi:hypothetical protein